MRTVIHLDEVQEVSELLDCARRGVIYGAATPTFLDSDRPASHDFLSVITFNLKLSIKDKI